MNEMLAIVEAILGWNFPSKSQIGDELFACLERVCPSGCDDGASREAQQCHYLAIRQAVLIALRKGACDVLEQRLDSEPVPVLPLNDLQAVLREVRREVVRWSRLALFWSQADVIPWYDGPSRTLYADGQLVYRWSGHADGGPQLTILAAFQEEDWATAIDCPLPPNVSAADTCRKLNYNVGKLIRFETCGEQIRWGYNWRTR